MGVSLANERPLSNRSIDISAFENEENPVKHAFVRWAAMMVVVGLGVSTAQAGWGWFGHGGSYGSYGGSYGG